jgi:hypothetical protein
MLQSSQRTTTKNVNLNSVLCLSAAHSLTTSAIKSYWNLVVFLLSEDSVWWLEVSHHHNYVAVCNHQRRKLRWEWWKQNADVTSLQTAETKAARAVRLNAPTYTHLVLLPGRLQNHVIYDSGVTTNHKNHILFYPHHHTHRYSHRPQSPEPWRKY